MRRKAFLGLVASAVAAPMLRATARAQLPGPATSAPRPTQQVQGPAASADASPVLSAVIDQQFTPMQQTRYEHTYLEDPASGTYFYDCVGMVTYSLGLGAPTAHAELMA